MSVFGTSVTMLFWSPVTKKVSREDGAPEALARIAQRDPSWLTVKPSRKLEKRTSGLPGTFDAA